MPTAPPDALGLPQKGTIIAGKYLVEDILGQGGMGVVVAARHMALRQRVAVKFLLPAGMGLPGARERFLREAQAAAAIQSEHVARVLDVGTLESGAPYLVMEYLSGTDLSRVLKARGHLSITEAVDLVLQATEAIGEAHGLGIVHRDLKPQNLFVITRGSAPFVKVLDFGLSKMTAESDMREVSLTATGLVVGSPFYMSPEQIRGLKWVDARTDVWALGVILYHLLTGRRPFTGDSLVAVCASVAADTPAPLRAHRADVPPALDALVLRCLEKDPARRVQSVAELSQGLRPFAPARASLPSLTRDVAPASLAPASALTPGAPNAATSTLQSQITTHLSTWEQTRPRSPSRMVAPLATLGAAVVIGGIVAGVALLSPRVHRKTAAQAATSGSAAPSTGVAREASAQQARSAPEASAPGVPVAPVAPVAPPPDSVNGTRLASATTIMPIVPIVPIAPRPTASGAPLASAKATAVPPVLAAKEPASPEPPRAPQPKTKKDLLESWN